MDFIKSFLSVYMNDPMSLVLTIALFLLCILLKVYYPKFRGYMGEFWVRMELNKLPKNKYLVFNDLMFSDEYGTHQIDHIVLSKYGIFVIEMKNYYGLIKGREYDNNWVQYLGKTKNTFYNPIHQNYGHIKSLSNLLKIDEEKFISIICFSNQAKLSIDSKTTVVQTDLLTKSILKWQTEINNEDLNSLFSILTLNNIKDKTERRRHVEKINQKISQNKDLTDSMICPKCGSKLIEKTGKYGKFIGCSNFPKCKFIKK